MTSTDIHTVVHDNGFDLFAYSGEEGLIHRTEARINSEGELYIDETHPSYNRENLSPALNTLILKAEDVLIEIVHELRGES